jgi:hypothetical protein
MPTHTKRVYFSNLLFKMLWRKDLLNFNNTSEDPDPM